MALKDRGLLKFPALVIAQTGLAVIKAAGVFTFFLRYRDFVSVTGVPDLSKKEIVIYERGTADDGTDDVYNTISLLSLTDAFTSEEQHITAAGPATVANDTAIVRVDQTAGAPITINLPPAENKTVPVLIADWKGDAGTNNITITPTGSETIQGLSGWAIAADNGSVFLRPIAGVGWAL